MSATSIRALGRSAQERIDLLTAERPVVVEVGDNSLHEGLREPNGAVLVAEVIVEDRQRQLLRALALIGPFEAVAGETLDVIVLIEPLAVDRHNQAIDRPLPLICLHGHTDTVARVK